VTPLVSTDALAELAAFIEARPRVFVLTGAGVSTDSGIPGYRDDDGAWQRSAPITLQAFLGSDAARRRYWARSAIGWPLMARAQPGPAHVALAALATQREFTALVTQNVDGLHERAGSRGVLELHGNVSCVRCLDCGTRSARAELQRELLAMNPAFGDVGAKALPDGDADVEPADLAAFHVPACARCGGMLKPDVVFFGEGVPRERVDAAFSALEHADAMLVVGSSLMVYSGYRFCERAAALGVPIVAINRGRTRADHLYALKIETPCGAALEALVAALV
jgi:NAD-dependent SIR2 family protein deacetylase